MYQVIHADPLGRIGTARPAGATLRRGAKVRDAASDSTGRSLGKLVEERLGVLQILRVEALGEPVVDRGEERAGLVASPLIAEQAGQARGGPQLERTSPAGSSRSRSRGGGDFPPLRSYPALVQEDLGPQAMELGVHLVHSRFLRPRDAEVESVQSVVVASDLREGLGEAPEAANHWVPIRMRSISAIPCWISATPSLSPCATARAQPRTTLALPRATGNPSSSARAMASSARSCARPGSRRSKWVIPAMTRACARLSGCFTRLASATASRLIASPRSGWPS